MNSVNTGWNDEDFSTIEKDLIKSQGIVDENADGSDLVVEENSPQQMNVLVNSGVAYVHITKNGRDWWVRVANDAQAQVTVAPNVSGSTRIDALILRVSVSTEPNASATNVATLAMVQGTPGGAAPSDGDINTALGSDGWIRLANITVDNGVGQIFTADIEDTRDGISFGLGNSSARITFYGDGSQLTGVVHSPVDEDLLPDTDSTYDLGSALKQFKDLYLSGNADIDGDMIVGGVITGDGGGITNLSPDDRTVVAGETIAGATLPVAVYQDISTGKYFACDANDNAKLAFVGFANTTANADENIKVRFDGIIGGFSGLTSGSNYYVQDDKTIGLNRGTREIFVGVAISATEIIIIKNNLIAVDLSGSESGWSSGSTDYFTFIVPANLLGRGKILKAKAKVVFRNESSSYGSNFTLTTLFGGTSLGTSPTVATLGDTSSRCQIEIEVIIITNSATNSQRAYWRYTAYHNYNGDNSSVYISPFASLTIDITSNQNLVFRATEGNQNSGAPNIKMEALIVEVI